MGLLDKLKGVFFEEEVVEVEDDEREQQREKIREKEKEKEKERVTVAKKIETPDFKRNEESALRKEALEVVDLNDDTTEEFKREKEIFPRFDDKDFEVEKTIELDEPIKENYEEVKEEPVHEEYHYEEEVTYSRPVYEEPPVPVKEETREAYHGLYEGHREKEQKPTFTPSPIISPIYGVLNKNYKKEEIVTKKEIRLSQTSTKKADLDVVREKAYGDLAGEISLSIEENNNVPKKDELKEEVKADTKEDLLYDLNDESPTVKVVTVGDAEEYFNDLGLEYNVDYKVEADSSKGIKMQDDVIDFTVDDKPKEENTIDIDESNDDKNLFDLIDSMYEDKE